MARGSLAPHTLKLEATGWDGAIRQALEHRLSAPDLEPVAVFDFDNTCIRNDIGEAVFVRLISDLAYRGDLEQFWELFPDPVVAAELRRHWERSASSPGHRPPPAERKALDAASRDHLALVYSEYLTMEAENVEAAYAWAATLLTGLTAEEVARLTRSAWDEALRQPLEPPVVESRARGRVPIPGGIRIHAEIRELIAQLRDALNWEVWVVSATNQYSVRAVAPELGLEPERVIGMELVETADRRFAPEVVRPVPVGRGKVAALDRLGLSPSLVVGDSLTDLDMLRRARTVALVIDRGKIPAEAMSGPSWLVQPAGSLTLEPATRKPA